MNYTRERIIQMKSRIKKCKQTIAGMRQRAANPAFLLFDPTRIIIPFRAQSLRVAEIKPLLIVDFVIDQNHQPAISIIP